VKRISPEPSRSAMFRRNTKIGSILFILASVMH
jgi:hypothetical protein